MIVYHGSTVEVEHPDVTHSKRFLDFGNAFYVTTYFEQAKRWARRKCMRSPTPAAPVVNEYEFPDTLDGLRALRFSEVDAAWFDFVCACREGKNVVGQYDVIIGRVANDDVFKTIQKFQQGKMSKQEAIAELKYAQPNDQIALVTSEAISRCLKFVKSHTLSNEG